MIQKITYRLEFLELKDPEFEGPGAHGTPYAELTRDSDKPFDEYKKGDTVNVSGPNPRFLGTVQGVERGHIIDEESNSILDWTRVFLR
jgi:hypothetical protein